MVPAPQRLPLPGGLSLRRGGRGAARLPHRLAHARPTRAALRAARDVLVHAAGSGVSSAAHPDRAAARRAAHLATAEPRRRSSRARASSAPTHDLDYREADFAARGARGDRRTRRRRRGRPRRRRDVREEPALLAPGGRIVLCGATAGPTAKINLRARLLQEPVDPRLDHGPPRRACGAPPPLRERRAAAGRRPRASRGRRRAPRRQRRLARTVRQDRPRVGAGADEVPRPGALT